jgi:hypothetical protein
MLKRSLLLILISLAAVNCQKNGEPLATPVDDGSAAQQADNAVALFSDSIGSFEVMVFYEAGAEPMAGNISGTTTPIWELTKKTFAALFNNHVGRFIFVPSLLGQFIQLTDQNKTVWTDSTLVKLGRQNAPDLVQQGDARISIFFLNGTYNGNPDVLGVHVRGSAFAFVFKDAVNAVTGDAKSRAYIEQSIVVHELGHVSGLVNNGVPLATPHEDPAHPKHSTNAECAMHWKIESRGSALSAVANAVSSDRQILYGNETLIDGRTFHP